MRLNRSHFNTYAVLSMTMIFWASAFVSIRIGLHSYSPGAMGLFRYLIASVCMIFIYVRLPVRHRIAWRDLPLILLSGIMGIGLYNVAINYGELTTPAATASFVIAQTPVVVILLAFIFLSERLTWRDTVGLCISFVGVMIIAFGQHAHMHYNAGVWFVLIATVSGGLYTILLKRLLVKFTALEVTVFAIWSGTASLLYYLPSLFRELHTASFWATTNVIYLGIFPAAIAYTGWSYVLARMKASDAILAQYFLPFLTTIIGFVVLRELPGFWAFVGGIIAMLGAFFATWRNR